MVIALIASSTRTYDFQEALLLIEVPEGKTFVLPLGWKDLGTAIEE